MKSPYIHLKWKKNKVQSDTLEPQLESKAKGWYRRWSSSPHTSISVKIRTTQPVYLQVQKLSSLACSTVTYVIADFVAAEFLTITTCDRGTMCGKSKSTNAFPCRQAIWEV